MADLACFALEFVFDGGVHLLMALLAPRKETTGHEPKE